MKGLLHRLIEFAPRATASERILIDWFQTHDRSCVRMSARSIAAASGVSSSTLVRLVRKLGFEGLRDFQLALMADIASSHTSSEIRSNGVSSGDSTQDIIDKVTNTNATSLSLTRAMLDPQTIDAVVGCMGSAKRIALFGAGASLLVAQDLQLKLLRIDLPCILCEDFHSQVVYARNLTERDLAIFVSYSGSTSEIVSCARFAREHQCKIVAITCGSFDSPLSKLSDYVLGVAESELLVRTGAMSSRIAQLDIADILFATYVSRNYEACMRHLSTTFIRKPGTAGLVKSSSRRKADSHG